MQIVMLSSECSPIAKVGGLADVIIGLSKSLQQRNHDVSIILPKYDCMHYEKISDLKTVYYDLPVMYKGEWRSNDVMSGIVEGVKCYFIDAKWYKNYFNRNTIYGEGDDSERFAYFSKAALEFLFRTEMNPDIIHAHDWPTALASVIQREIYYHEGMISPRLVYTVHNFAHQGIASQEVLQDCGISPYKLSAECYESYGIVNFMKAAIVYSDYITTVSPNYSKEVRFSDKGMGLEYLLNKYHYKFGGILNGIDDDYWDPSSDSCLPHHYSATSLEEKYKNKAALRKKFLLRDEFKPIVAVVSRLVRQKGVDLIQHSIPYSLQQGAQFVLLGSSPEAKINNEFQIIQHQLHDNPDCHLEFGFNEELSHLVYAGADMLIIPSLFEPCGLTQLIAMRYGTVPVVRLTGGLADTVRDIDHSTIPYELRNGYTFNDTDHVALESALGRAIKDWFEQPEKFQDIVKNGMKANYSWDLSSKKYITIYEYLHTRETT